MGIVKHFKNYKDSIEIQGYDKYLSEEIEDKINSILENIDDKYRNGEGEKAENIRLCCVKELNELEELLQADLKLSLYKRLFRMLTKR